MLILYSVRLSTRRVWRFHSDQLKQRFRVIASDVIVGLQHGFDRHDDAIGADDEPVTKVAVSDFGARHPTGAASLQFDALFITGGGGGVAVDDEDARLTETTGAKDAAIATDDDSAGGGRKRSADSGMVSGVGGSGHVGDARGGEKTVDRRLVSPDRLPVLQVVTEGQPDPVAADRRCHGDVGLVVVHESDPE